MTKVVLFRLGNLESEEGLFAVRTSLFQVFLH